VVFTLVSKKLIILGNGFDLACGLKSRYYDFFSSRLNENLVEYLDYAADEFKKNMYFSNKWFPTLFGLREKNEKYGRKIGRIIHDDLGEEHEIYKIVEQSDLTFWDFVFYYSNFRKNDRDIVDYDWCDIENRMLEFLQTPEDLKDVPSIDNFNSLGSLLCLHLAYYLPREDKVSSQSEAFNYLYEELRTFEKYFSRYIADISENLDYQREAIKILVNISGNNVQEIKDKIFSFNYTDPFSFNPYSSRSLDIVNVHGKAATNSILFGVDQESIIPESKAFRFTKTFRQMTETRLDKNYEDIILPKKDDIQEIAFFGHSLSKFDYSYFQTIFDHYDLYNSAIRLVFYYKIFGNRTPKDMELELAERISKMLYDYSPSIDNKKRGRNLTHKLLLEKRLIMKEI
jgi:hypothetical protein